MDGLMPFQTTGMKDGPVEIVLLTSLPRRSEISHQTRIHRRPIDPLKATDKLIRRLKAEARPNTVSRTAIERNG